jgi:hypothetical protein
MMRFVVVLVGLSAACTKQQGGTPITGCDACGSGALRAGVVLASTPLVAASANGTSAYIDGNQLVWLGSDFEVTDSTDVAPDSSATSGEVRGLYADAAGNMYAYDVSMDDIDEWESEIGFGADHRQFFRADNEVSFATGSPIAGDPEADLALYIVRNPDGQTDSLTASDTSNDSVAWTTGYRSSDAIAIASGPDGTIAFAGNFQALSLTNNTLVAGVLITSVDPTTGFGTWSLNVTGTGSAVPAVAVGPDGEIAVSLKADSAGDPVTLGNQTLGSDETFVALLERTGALRWSQQVPFNAGSLVTDGTVVDIGDGDTLAQVSSSGIDWQQTLAGASSTTVRAIANSQLVISTVLGPTGIDGVSGPGTLIADVAR